MGSNPAKPFQPLRPREKRFAEEYLVDLNATAAAKRVGYSESAAHVTGGNLLTRPRVAHEIQRLQRERSMRTQVRADRVLEELARIAFGSPRGLFSASGKLLPPSEWGDDEAAAIASVEVVTRNLGEGEVEHVAKVRSWDKVRALELLAKHLRLLVDRVEHDVSEGLAEKLAAARRRKRVANEAGSGAAEERAQLVDTTAREHEPEHPAREHAEAEHPGPEPDQ